MHSKICLQSTNHYACPAAQLQVRAALDCFKVASLKLPLARGIAKCGDEQCTAASTVGVVSSSASANPSWNSLFEFTPFRHFHFACNYRSAITTIATLLNQRETKTQLLKLSVTHMYLNPNEQLAQLCRKVARVARVAMESGLKTHLMMETSVACQRKSLFESQNPAGCALDDDKKHSQNTKNIKRLAFLHDGVEISLGLCISHLATSC